MANDVGSAIQAKFLEDPDFREQLKADPRAVLTEVVGEDLPEDVEIVVVENGPKTFHIVLPPSDIRIEEMNATVGGWQGWQGISGGFCN